MKDYQGPALGSKTGGEEKRIGFEFNGTAGAYYRIYMNNVFLTMLTLGLYGPWAKVRRRRYFYGNTSLLGHAFDYDARPLAILLSRLLVVGVSVAAAFGSFYLPDFVGEEVELADLVWSLFVLVVLPFAVVRGRGFNTRYTIHRSVRFSYARIYWPAYRAVFMFWGPPLLLSALSLFLGDDTPLVDGPESFRWSAVGFGVAVAYTLLVWPFWLHAWHRVQIDQLSFGKMGCSFDAPLRAYLRAYLPVPALGLLLLWMLYELSYQPFVGYGQAAWEAKGSSEREILVATWLLGQVATVVGSWIALSKVYASFVTPVYWSSIDLDGGGGRLTSSVRPMVLLFRILLLNLFLTTVTLGLYHPVAKVRQWRYLARNTGVALTPELEEISRGKGQELSPLMAEYSDIDGMDIDFGTI